MQGETLNINIYMQIALNRKRLDNLFQVDLRKIYLWDKRRVTLLCLYASMLLVYFGSLHPWFLWPLKELYPIPAAALLFVGYLVGNSMEDSLFSRRDFLWGLAFYVILSTYIMIVGNQNINAYIVNIASIFIFFILLRSNIEILNRLSTVLCKAMALLLIPSMFFFLLYLLGFPLPGKSATYGNDQYSFTNFYFFMVDDRSLMLFIPRFQSVFLEPGHLGSATSLLLMTQFGQWKRWWNIVLIIASIISFSLAAYAIIIALMFLGLWVQRRNIVKHVVISVSLLATVTVGAIYYNGGDNMLNALILARLEIDERTGDMVGNNRVDVDFEKEYDKFIVSSDAFFGRDMTKIARGSGNSGYRVFIYQNGLIGLFLLILFYGACFRHYQDVRYLLCAIVISLLIFWIRGYLLWYSNFIPLLSTALSRFSSPSYSPKQTTKSS